MLREATCACRRRVGEDRPGRLGVTGGHGLDRSRHREECGLKNRADNETRTIPILPELVKLLRAHIKRYGTTTDGRISRPPGAAPPGFRLRRGVDRGPQGGPYTPAQCRSPLGRRPYDLRRCRCG